MYSWSVVSKCFNIFFPTSLCGVLVFDSVSRAPPPPPPHTHNTHTHITHTHTTHTYTHTHTHTHHTHTHTTHTSHTHTPHTHHTHTHTHIHTPPPPPHTHTHTHITHTHITHTQTHTHHTHTHNTTQHNTHTHHYRRFVWPAWDRWHWVARLDWFRRRRDARDAAPLCVAGVALGDIHLDFTWQVWHNLTSTVVLRGRRGTDGTGWRAWTGLGAAVTPVTPRHFCVAGVALGDIHLDFTWQAWHNLTSTVVLRGRRGTDGTGWRAWTGLGAAVTPVTPRHFCVAGVALGDIHLDFTWQAWHNLTSTVA